MQVRFPLLARILALFLVNLLLVGLAVFLVLRLQLQLGLDSLMAGRAGQRVLSVSRVLTEALRDKDPAGQGTVLSQYSQAYKLQFSLFRADGVQVAGDTLDLPSEVLARFRERRGFVGDGLGRGPPVGKGPRRGAEEADTEVRVDFAVQTVAPKKYWVSVRLPLRDGDSGRPRPLFLLVASDTLHGGGLFVDIRPLVLTGALVLAASILFWVPLVHSLTRTIRRMTQATQAIAEGRFETRVSDQRSDELGLLGQSINRLGTRLSGFVTGQKRFLGDIAHELCSPVARMQMSLSILERGADSQQQATIKDLREEVEDMSRLINELLSFSKAGLSGETVALGPVNIADLVGRVIRRECPDSSQVQVDIPPNLIALGEADLLARAMGNLVRNAVRYAGHAGPVTLRGVACGHEIALQVRDCGPGVPEDLLPRIFDPFFRADPSRSRETGGVGLGLAIVKGCVEACQGSAQATNLEGGGFCVELRLRAAGGEITPLA